MEEPQESLSLLISPANLPTQSLMHPEASKAKSRVRWNLEAESFHSVNSDTHSQLSQKEQSQHRNFDKENMHIEQSCLHSRIDDKGSQQKGYHNKNKDDDPENEKDKENERKSENENNHYDDEPRSKRSSKNSERSQFVDSAENRQREILILEHSVKANLLLMQRQSKEIFGLERIIDVNVSIEKNKKIINARTAEIRRLRIACRKTGSKIDSFHVNLKSASSRTNSLSARSARSISSRRQISKNVQESKKNANLKQPRYSPSSEYFTGSSFHLQSPSTGFVMNPGEQTESIFQKQRKSQYLVEKKQKSQNSVQKSPQSPEFFLKSQELTEKEFKMLQSLLENSKKQKESAESSLKLQELLMKEEISFLRVQRDLIDERIVEVFGKEEK